MRSENIKAQRAKFALSAAIVKLLEHESFDQITITQIAQQSTYSRQTFYQHFETKEEALQFYLDNLFKKQFASLKQAKKITLQKGMRAIATFWQDYGELIKAINRNRLNGLLVECFTNYLKVYFAYYHLKPNSAAGPADYIYRFLAGGEIAVLVKWFTTANKITPEQIATILSTMMQPFIVNS